MAIVIIVKIFVHLDSEEAPVPKSVRVDGLTLMRPDGPDAHLQHLDLSGAQTLRPGVVGLLNRRVCVRGVHREVEA